jgi:NAD(P)-dependent dehydrogenase (short-subunit alcohol dehydrogenase family)
MRDKVVVVTGANSGIGKMTAVGLARAGATVVMACRDLAKSRPALDDVRSRSGSDRVHLMQLDLASQASIRAFVQAFNDQYNRLDVLINNAGVASPKRRETADGFELHFGVHHLGSFLLTTLLLPVLDRTAPSRVLLVAGSAQRRGRIAWDDLQGEQKYSMMQAGGQSRVANLLFMRALTQRAKGPKVIKQNPIALDDDNAQRLWQISEQLTSTSTTVL